MISKVIKVILGILFIPVVIAATKAFFITLDNLSLFNINLYLFIGGFFTYPIFQIVFLKPMYLYALGHEITHVLATWLCGGRVTSFHISRDGGQVTTTKTNVFIRLSPYFVPIHTVFLLLVYWGLSRFFDVSGFSQQLVFLIGFTISLHIFMTITIMKIEQPDIVKTGYLFSVLFIYTTNIVMSLLILSFIFKDISFVYFLKKTFFISKEIYLSILAK